MTWRLLALPPLPLEVLRAGFARDADVEVVVPAERTQQALLTALADAELVLGDWSGSFRLDAAAFAAAPKLAFVQQPAAGTDSIDSVAAAGHGVPVSNVGAANAVSVTEWCLAAAFVLRRQVIVAEQALRAGEWPQTSLAIQDVAGAKVGILGLGNIGRLTADRFAALGCEVSYWSRTEKDVPYPWLSPADLMAGSDIVVCLLPGGADTRHLVSAEMLGRMPAGALFISAGRGSVVDEAALAEALRDKAIGGAALDVYEREPLPMDSPLRELPNVLLSPHTGGSSRGAQLAIVAACQRNIAAAAAGAPVSDVVNGVDPLVRRRP
ncbi:MAG: NAD(P)-dependent oxidoreductase [Mycobacteriales bacterium]